MLDVCQGLLLLLASWVAVNQGLHLPEAVVDRLQNVERRLNGSLDGSANEVLPLRGALGPSENVLLAIDEVSTLLRYLRIWDIENLVDFYALMAAHEDYLSGVFFQASPPPGAVGLSIALQRLIDAAEVDCVRTDVAADVLVCSRGGGGLLTERMEIVNDLWSANIKAEYLCSEAPSFTEQYEYAHDNGIKWLVIITKAALSLAGTVKVRHLDLKVEEDVRKGELVKYLNDISSIPST